MGHACQPAVTDILSCSLATTYMRTSSPKHVNFKRFRISENWIFKWALQNVTTFMSEPCLIIIYIKGDLFLKRHERAGNGFLPGESRQD